MIDESFFCHEDGGSAPIRRVARRLRATDAPSVAVARKRRFTSRPAFSVVQRLFQCHCQPDFCIYSEPIANLSANVQRFTV